MLVVSSSNEAKKSLGNSSKDVACVRSIVVSLDGVVMSFSKAVKRSDVSGLLYVDVSTGTGCSRLIFWLEVSTV